MFDLTTVRKLYLNTKQNLVMLIFLSLSFSLKKNSNSGVLGIVLASSAVDHGLGSLSGQTKDIGICCFLAINHPALKSNTKNGWFGFGTMCPSGATRLPEECCFSELAL